MKHAVIRKALALFACAALLALTGCGLFNNSGDPSGAKTTEAADATPVSDSSINANEVTGEFIMTTADGAYTQDGTTYTVTKGGTYSLKGALEGQIIVSAGENDEVVLELNGTTIKCSGDSPIKILSADKVEISAKKGTSNVIKDERARKTQEDAELGEGAINSKCDLKLKGNGTLVIEANYNNGVHCSKDVEIKKLSLKVTAANNALKGKDSVSIESGTVVLISTDGDGVVTENTDRSSSGKQRGDVTVTGGSLTVYAAGDGIQSAHDFIMAAGDAGSNPTVLIYTGAYSSYTAETAATTSYKGVKAENSIKVSAGSIEVSSYDDGLHANYGTAFESGGTGEGLIEISGGNVVLGVYSPEAATGGGRMGPGGPGGGPGGPGGWSGQQAVTGADGIHADGKVSITGGTVNIDSAYEGVEANIIDISGGTVVVTAVDDGMNACKGAVTPQVVISGGFVDVAVSPNGDLDGIDSNGTYNQTGGVLIVRGPNSEMAAAIDAEGYITLEGGTMIVLGYGRVQTGSAISTAELSLHSEGSHTVSVNGIEYSFTNAYNYARTSVYTDTTVTGK
jgi:hypothetical protein